MKLLVPILNLGLLAACVPASEDTEPDAASPAAFAIEGDYVVTTVDNAAPMIGIEGHEPTVTIGPDRIHFQSQCIYSDWSFERNGQSIVTGPFDYGEPVAMCARGLAPGETAIMEVIDGADTLRSLEGDLSIAAGGRELKMRRMADTALSSSVIDLAGEWRVAGIDGESFDEPYGLALRADGAEIWWEPRCAGIIRSYTIKGTAFATAPRTSEPPADTRSPQRPVCAIGLPPRLGDVRDVLDGAETIQRTSANGIRISGGGRSLTLFSQ